jgi:hypothetical protein
MSEPRRASVTQANSDLARMLVESSRKRMLDASARAIAVKWRSTRRGDRFRTPKPGGGESPPA